MAKKTMFLQKVGLAVIFVVPALLTLGLCYNILSPREWAIGLIACFFTAILLVAIMQKRAAKKKGSSSAEPETPIDDRTRRRILREIWMRKLWVGLLAVSLPFGIANGVAYRASLPTLCGVAINLSLMYVAMQEIRQRRKRLDSNSGMNFSLGGQRTL